MKSTFSRFRGGALSCLMFSLNAMALIYAPEAQAVLGAGSDSLQGDQMRFGGQYRQRTEWPMQTHEISTADGSSIRQYVSASGVIFAVAWSTRLKPNLEALLGPHYATYSDSLHATAPQQALMRQFSVRRPNLVVHETGRMGAFKGVAYVPALVPAGVNADALR